MKLGHKHKNLLIETLLEIYALKVVTATMKYNLNIPNNNRTETLDSLGVMLYIILTIEYWLAVSGVHRDVYSSFILRQAKKNIGQNRPGRGSLRLPLIIDYITYSKKCVITVGKRNKYIFTEIARFQSVLHIGTWAFFMEQQ